MHIRATSLSSRTLLAFHFPLPFYLAYILRLFSFHSLLGSILSLSCIRSLRKHSLTLVLPPSAPQHPTPTTQVCHVNTLSLDTTHAPYCMHTGTISPLTLFGLLSRVATSAPTILYFSFCHTALHTGPPHSLAVSSLFFPLGWFVCVPCTTTSCVYSPGVSIFRVPFPYSSPPLGNLYSVNQSVFPHRISPGFSLSSSSLPTTSLFMM